ncbi:MAG: tetraacyldisaccharide 4'-kinase [Candidatus Hydrogenedentes bacterium]|nr:tetraacyldisaccharide 4'-kinase [Candidatus Hydrogenedentota bacterium]
MSFIHDLSEKVRNGEPIPAPIAALLTAATPVQRAGMWLRLRGSRERVDARVISFGNITAGGTGKTPAVIERVQQELAAGHKVAVLTRGYGAKITGLDPLVVPGEDAASMWQSVGDEPALIAQRAPTVVIAKSADRVASAREAIKQFGCDMLILDDGFQYVRLERDENIVVIDATNPFGNGRLVPRGILREPVSALARATQVILTRCGAMDDMDSMDGMDAGLAEALRRYCPNAPVRRTRHAPDSLWRVADGEATSLEELRGQRVTAVCAIGNPDGFYRTLEELGAVVVERRGFRDHAVVPPEALAADGMVVTTEKDAVRMTDAPENVLALGVALRDVGEG